MIDLPKCMSTLCHVSFVNQVKTDRTGMKDIKLKVINKKNQNDAQSFTDFTVLVIAETL